jgi:hypothetical protein
VRTKRCGARQRLLLAAAPELDGHVVVEHGGPGAAAGQREAVDVARQSNT